MGEKLKYDTQQGVPVGSLQKKTRIAYGVGAVGKDMVYMLVASYVLYYYNSVLGVSSVFIGTVLMAARVFDAFNDPIMGIVVAKTRSRWGRFRPWILLRGAGDTELHLQTYEDEGTRRDFSLCYGGQESAVQRKAHGRSHQFGYTGACEA